MVTIIDSRVNVNAEGKPFVSLQLEGEPELIQSMETGRFYMTARRCLMPTTFNEATAQRLIGSRLPGGVCRVESEPYDFTVPETGEVIKLAHRYEYQPEEQPSPSLRQVTSQLV